jgi:arsenate reductase
MGAFTIYHNPRCTKSRETLALLERRGIEPRIVEYLKTPPSATELKAIVDKLGIEPEQLVRKSEEIYKSRYAGKKLTGAQWIAAMVQDPILIERPIVVSGERAALGRPPENVEKLIGGKR